MTGWLHDTVHLHSLCLIVKSKYIFSLWTFTSRIRSKRIAIFLRAVSQIQMVKKIKGTAWRFPWPEEGERKNTAPVFSKTGQVGGSFSRGSHPVTFSFWFSGNAKLQNRCLIILWRSRQVSAGNMFRRTAKPCGAIVWNMPTNSGQQHQRLLAPSQVPQGIGEQRSATGSPGETGGRGANQWRF